MLGTRAHKEIFSEESIQRALKRIAHEIVERNSGASELVLAGILTRGIYLAHRLAHNINLFYNKRVVVLEVDARPFRDDVERLGKQREALPLSQKLTQTSIEAKTVVLVDDVIYTGRTSRSSMDALLANGRPDWIQLAVLVDRGHRELPIKPDYVGCNIPTSKVQSVKVNLMETDDKDSVELVVGV